MNSASRSQSGKVGQAALQFLSRYTLLIMVDMQNFNGGFASKTIDNVLGMMADAENKSKKQLFADFLEVLTISYHQYLDPSERLKLMNGSVFFRKVYRDFLDVARNPASFLKNVRLSDRQRKKVGISYFNDPKGSKDEALSPSTLKPKERRSPKPRNPRPNPQPPRDQEIEDKNPFDDLDDDRDPESSSLESPQVDDSETSSEFSEGSDGTRLSQDSAPQSLLHTQVDASTSPSLGDSISFVLPPSAIDAANCASDSEKTSDCSEVSDATDLPQDSAPQSPLQMQVSFSDSPRVGPAEGLDVSPTSVQTRRQTLSSAPPESASDAFAHSPPHDDLPGETPLSVKQLEDALRYVLDIMAREHLPLVELEDCKADYLMTGVVREQYVHKWSVTLVLCSDDKDFYGVTGKYGVMRVGTDGSWRPHFFFHEGVELRGDQFLLLRALLGGGKETCCDPAIGPVPMDVEYEDPTGKIVVGGSQPEAGHVPNKEQLAHFKAAVTRDKVWKKKLPKIYAFLDDYGRASGFDGLRANFDANMKALNIDQTDENLSTFWKSDGMTQMIKAKVEGFAKEISR